LREQAEFQEMANGDLLRQLLEILDDFERALAAGPSSDNEGTFRSGVEMIAGRLDRFLRSYGVIPMEALGQIFDPSRHEAVAHEATGLVPESTVLAELRKGYLMNGRVLRHAAVKVAVKPVEGRSVQFFEKDTGST
jgi:molecular chaperone GrpE